jgi:hypothetical protein
MIEIPSYTIAASIVGVLVGALVLLVSSYSSLWLQA